MNKERFYKCEHCGNIIGMIKDSGVPIICCGEKMKLLEPGVVDASVEKHVPDVSVNSDEVTVKVGAVEHPMVEEHYIEWIYLQTKKGGQRKALNPNDKPQATFKVIDDEIESVYAYCNIHGLWKKDIK